MGNYFIKEILLDIPSGMEVMCQVALYGGSCSVAEKPGR